MVCAVLISAPTASATAASRGVVGEWPLNEGVGTQAADISGSGNNGTLSGGATWVNDGSGSALSFDGVSGQVKVPNNPSLEPASGVTVQAWVKHTGSPGQYRYVLAKGATGCIAASYGLYTGPNGGLEFYVSRDRGTVYARSSDAGQAVWDGRWHLVVGTFDGDVIRLFVDGAEVGSGITYPGSLEYLLPASNDLYIGSYPGCDQHEFLGFIDDAMVWNRALTPQEVEGVLPEQGSGANPPLSPPASSGLTGATRRPDGSGPTQSGSTQPASGAPSLSRPRVFGRTLTLAADGRLSDGAHHAALILTYGDAQGSRVTLTLIRLQSGVRLRRRCVAPRHTRGRHRRSCTRQVVIGSFTHADQRGMTTLRFTGIPGHRLVKGRYRLVLTPRNRGRTGRPVVVAFTVR